MQRMGLMYHGVWDRWGRLPGRDQAVRVERFWPASGWYQSVVGTMYSAAVTKRSSRNGRDWKVAHTHTHDEETPLSRPMLRGQL